jgi:glycosyltransferase involved in cell wall biosynthesis
MTFKIAHLSTSSRGGAAVAAQELSNALSNKGLDSTLISRDNLRNFEYRTPRKFSNNFLGKIVTQFQAINTRPPFGIATPVSISNLETARLLRTNFDLLHIHNWYNLLNVNDLNMLAKSTPLVFTFHDERLITGGCHTTIGCKNFESSCTNCPAVRTHKSGITKSKRELMNLLSVAPNVSAISPSKWIIEQIQNAGLATNFTSLVHIPNIISSEYFTSQAPHERDEKITKLLFISADLNTEIKGLRLLFKSLEILTSDVSLTRVQEIELHLIGGGELPDGDASNFKVIRHGYRNRDQIKRLMSQSTFLVVPSLSENSPNVIAEAQLMGLPVIGSDVAGIPELIRDSETGFLAPTNAEGLSVVISKALTSKNLQKIALSAQSSARLRYDIELITQAHIDVYEKALRAK